MEQIIPNMIATSIAEIITLPICTIKTNHQTSNNKFISETIKQMYKKAGIKGFYQASFFAVLSQVASTTSKYTIYKSLGTYRETKKDDLFNNSINGIICGLAGSLISHPIDVIKNYQQRNQSFINDFKVKKHRIIYQGYSQTILKNVVLYSILYPINDFYYSKTNNFVLSSVATTITAGIFTQPIDYLKTRFMAGIYTFEIRNLYKGFNLMLFRNIPHFLITMKLINLLNNY